VKPKAKEIRRTCSAPLVAYRRHSDIVCSVTELLQ
jgi:hypothetical protein